MLNRQLDCSNSAGRSRVPVIAGTALVSALAAAGGVALLLNIFERRQEGENPFYRVVDLDDNVSDPEVWGRNFPLQYDSYLGTVDQIRTRFGGSEAMPRIPTDADPRSVVAQSRLDEDPRLRTMWAGYAFAVDFREERGHAYMLEDQTLTERQEVAEQPGTCVHCHASMVVPYRELGNGDLRAGFDRLNQMTYDDARDEVSHAVACIDCHDPETMQLRVTRPAFMDGIRLVKGLEGITDYDVNRDATRQEMRAYVCGQCHVEYYFSKPESTLTYPWANGLKVDDIYAYYEEIEFVDWTHGETGAPVLKAQHPEFEMWNQGIHARSGVTCADCHMPYTRVGALKISDHHVQSPVLNIAAACQTCHPWGEDELRDRVETIQTRLFNARDRTMDALIDLIEDIQEGAAAGAPEESLAVARTFQRRAQFYLDFVEAENSTGFHAPQEATRILVDAVDYVRQGQNALP
jgi:nitrite reductase (cytochrome c-552)